MMNTIAACTIVSKNYLPFARTLADSFIKHHKDATFFVLLVDKIDGYFDPSKEKFQLIEVDELDNIKHKEQMFFKYNILELNTAVKPFLLEYIFRHYPVKQLIYLDPDILITNPLNEIQNLLNTYSIVIIPHITNPIPIDNALPNELTFLQCGIYNLGFIGVSANEETTRFLQWWKERLWYFCTHDVPSGLFVDQKWIDLVPAFFNKIFILKEPGYNVAYWNFHEKTFSIKDNKLMVNDEPLYFFHFSGLQIENIDWISKYQTRYVLTDFKELKALFEYYKELLIKNGYYETKAWPYYYGFYDNGEKIKDTDRRKYWSMGVKVKGFGNPFQAKHRKSFYEYINMPFKFYNNKLFERWASKIIPLGLKHKEKIRRIPFVGRKAKGLYYKLLPLLSERTKVTLGADDHDILKVKIPDVSNAAYGINLAGYLDTESGVGESARSLIKTIRAAAIPFAFNNIEQPWMRRDDKTYSHLFVKENPYCINLLHVNADQAPYITKMLGENYFSSKYNIGYWYWELSKFPYDEWKESFDYFDEIWVASNFCLNAISKVSPIKVVKISPAINVDINGNYTKDYFGIKPDSYVFLYMFDFLSFIERKNPFSVIESFRLAYQNFDMRNSILVIKCSNIDKKPREYEQLLNSTKNLPVLIISKYLSKDELHGLVSISDCYVSLHRSEGFGLPIAEAMYLGKPVIVTAYSGNMDFTNNKNSYLVNYDLSEIKTDTGPYKKGNVWAEPDIKHAANLIFRTYNDQEESNKIAQEASRYIKEHYSPEILSVDLYNRVQLIMSSMKYI